MAKMKIYEIARSIQQQDKNIKSGDLVTLLNENGFEVKGANSNIEDEAIGFLMNYFKKKKAAAKAEPKEEVKTPVKEEPKVEKKEEPKVEKKVEEKKEEPKVEKKPEEKKPEEKKPEEKKLEEKKPVEKKPEEKKVSSQKPQQPKKNDNYRKPNNNGQGRNDRNDRNDRDRRNGNGNGSRPDNRGNNGNNNGRRNDRNDRDRRANNNGQNSRGDNRRNGNGNGNNNNRVFERFEKAQSGFDGIKQEQKNSRQRNRKKDDRNNKPGGYRKSTKEEMSRIRSKKDPNRKGAFIKPEPVKQEPEEEIKQITIPESLTIRELADKMKMPAAALVKKLFMQGQMVSLNQEITFDEAEEIALSFDIIAELEEKVDMVAELLKEEEEDESKMKKRPPVVCVMGHVDHGKTSLLDAIRETDVTEHEAGGITQHIGAYVVRINGEKITFLDTPGHEAFTSMRMRGAQSTDVAVLVVAADDGVMPQTVEAINHAKAAGVEIIVAINKIDKEGANIERVKQELSEYELIPEEWGGSTIFCPVSAHTKEGISNLLEMIILTAEVLELKANPKRRARGIVIEAQLDKGRGPVATVLVQKGTLNVGDHIAVGTAYGKVRAMLDHKGERVKQATPSTPVEILGLNGVPSAGEIFVATENDKEAKQIAQAYVDQGKDKLLEETKAKKLSLDGLFSQIQAGNVKELNLIIKADVQGSVEAVKQSLVKLSNEEVAVRVIHGGVGAINESDVSLASASNAIIIGFNIRLDNAAKETADRENVDVRLYRVIYDAIEDIEAAMKGMLEPIYEEKVIAHAEVRQTFKASGVGTIAGSYVLDGKIERGCRARITREGEQIFEGDLSSLKRFKDDVKEVAAGYECGLVFDGFNDLQEEDQIECYKMVEVPR
ncbi:translation initiation factor IF-2 [Clostridium sp. AF36-4]|uniref:translation initiation factor IF-2 n=1 Tax=Clostridium sp. AF36-4 TaxID=2293015 RepID=UPI000E3F53DA|nr:translation initiation factor IF-2 [Clostridium sp. AF36-4]RGF58230.1 translation initiation factor IF-2 [Clostridium sp. AF36-4]